MPIPLGRAFVALARSMIDLWAIAGISAVVFLAAFVGGIRLMQVPEAVELWALGALFVLLHAIYLVKASRAIAANGDDAVTVEKLSVFGWVRAVLGIVVFATAVAAAFIAAVTTLTPYSPVYAAFMATIAVVAWTPFLPMMALGSRSIFAVGADGAPDLARFVWSAVWTSLPFLLVTGVLAWPIFGRDAISFGMFDGGIIAYPLLGLCLFTAVTTMALVPTVVYAALKTAAERLQ